MGHAIGSPDSRSVYADRFIRRKTLRQRREGIAPTLHKCTFLIHDISSEQKPSLTIPGCNQNGARSEAGNSAAERQDAEHLR